MGLIEDAVGIVRDVSFDLLAADASVEKAITYRKTSKTGYSPATGANTSSVVDETVTAIRSPITQAEVLNLELLAGDRKYLVRLDQFTTLTKDDFTESDHIIDGTDVWEVKMPKTEPTAQLAIFFARRVTS